MVGRKNKNIHANRLVESTPDDVALALAVEERFLGLCKLHLRLRGVELAIPQSLDEDVRRWRKMRVRHKGLDFRHTESEIRSVRTFAQWTCDVNCELRNQDRVVVNWGDR